MIHYQHRIDNSNKVTEIHQQHQQIANLNKKNPVSTTTTIHSTQNRQNAGNSSELPKNQGNHVITTTNYDSNVQETCRLIEEPVRIFRVAGRETCRNYEYQANFPMITSNFDRIVNRNVSEKDDHPIGNPNSFPKKDQIPEPTPYTVIQTYADRLRYNISKRGVSIKLNEPEITTEQGLPVVLYVKDEVVKDLASTCMFTLIGKFIYTMTRVDLIRKNYILQTQLSGGVKIAHFNSRHVYIDIDNEMTIIWYGLRNE